MLASAVNSIQTACSELIVDHKPIICNVLRKSENLRIRGLFLQLPGKTVADYLQFFAGYTGRNG
jgi:hypothetical protein